MKTRYIPQGYTEYKPELGDYPKDMFACYSMIIGQQSPAENHDVACAAIFYTGKQSEPTWYYRFESITAMKKRVNMSISNIMKREERKAERKQERKNAVLDVKVGDLFSYSWGYEQTNVDFYQVIKVTGKAFYIQQIARKYCLEAPSGPMSDYVMAYKDAFISDGHPRYEGPILKRGFGMPHGILSKTTESEKHFSSWYN